jgi:hypothetical protein
MARIGLVVVATNSRRDNKVQMIRPQEAAAKKGELSNYIEKNHILCLYMAAISRLQACEHHQKQEQLLDSKVLYMAMQYIYRAYNNLECSEIFEVWRAKVKQS